MQDWRNEEIRYLVDTDWCIDYLNGISRTVRRLDELRQEGIGMSIITPAELYGGVLNSNNPQRDEQVLLGFIHEFTIVELDIATCRIFAREKGRLRAAGAIIGDLDIFIGATALRHNLTLLTNNRRHFERLPGLTIISA